MPEAASSTPLASTNTILVGVVVPFNSTAGVGYTTFSSTGVWNSLTSTVAVA